MFCGRHMENLYRISIARDLLSRSLSGHLIANCCLDPATICPIPTIFVPAETVLLFDPSHVPFRFGVSISSHR